MKTILFIEHEGNIKEYAFQKAKEMGYRVIVASNTSSEVFKKYIDPDDIILTNTLNSQELVIAVVCFLSERKVKLDAIGTFRENVVIQTADLADALKLPGVGPGASRRSSQNKLLMRQVLFDAGFTHQPKFEVVNIYKHGFEKIIANFPKPCVIKPLYGTASLAVKMISTNEMISEDVEEIKSTIRTSSREAFKHFKGEMLLEQYIPGRVISIDGIVQNNQVNIIGSIDFIMGEEPYFVQKSSFIPAQLSTTERDECEKATKQIIGILGFETSGFHCEFRLTENGPILLEIAARLPGAGIYSTYDKVYGIDMIGFMFNAWLGVSIPNRYDSKYINFHSNFQIFDENEKVLVGLDNLEEVRQRPNVSHVSQTSVIGQKISVNSSSPTILYDYSVVGDSYDVLQKTAREIEKTIIYKIE